MSETAKRLSILDKFVKKVEPVADALVLTGSLAYGADFSVTEASDIDVIVISDNYDNVLKLISPETNDLHIPNIYYFEAICLTDEIDNVKISVHILPLQSLTYISSSYVADLRVYRPNGKDSSYKLRSFSGAEYTFKIRNVKLENNLGFRTLVPIGFIDDDKYYIGIYRDKLLCNPRVIFDKRNNVSDLIEKNWSTTKNIFTLEKNRLGNHLELSKSLVKYDRFSASARSYVHQKFLSK